MRKYSEMLWKGQCQWTMQGLQCPDRRRKRQSNVRCASQGDKDSELNELRERERVWFRTQRAQKDDLRGGDRFIRKEFGWMEILHEVPELRSVANVRALSQEKVVECKNLNEITTEEKLRLALFKSSATTMQIRINNPTRRF